MTELRKLLLPLGSIGPVGYFEYYEYRSALGAMFPAPKMAFSTRAMEISGKGRDAAGAVRQLRGILSILVAFWRRHRTSRSLLSCSSTMGDHLDTLGL
jgi:hypothetical protein